MTTTNNPPTDKDELKRRISSDALPWFLSQKGIEAYRKRSNYVVFDFETTNYTTGHALDARNSLVLGVWTVVKDGRRTTHHCFGDEYSMSALVRDIADADFIVAHNAKFDVQWLDRCGVDLRSLLVYDTMAVEWVIRGNEKVLYSLEDTARRYGVFGKDSLVSLLIKSGTCPSDIPRSWLLKYGIRDVDVCHEIFLKQVEILEERNLWHLALQRNCVVPVLAEIELQGLQLDKQKVYDEHKRLLETIENLGQELDAITGGINLASPVQLRHFLYEQLQFAHPLDNAGKPIVTSKNEPSTSIPALAKLLPTTPDQHKFLSLYKDYNQADSLLSKNIAFFKLVCDEKDGVFYGSLRQCRTANHRLASSGIKVEFEALKKKTLACQIQNLPRQYKSLFTCHDPDYVVTEYDGSQIEFRVAADLGHDRVAENDIVTGVDIHSFTRDTMNEAYVRFNIRDPFGKVKEIDRQGAKPNTFAPLIYSGFNS